MTDPYLEFLSLKIGKIRESPSVVPPIQFHSFLGSKEIDAFKEATRRTKRSIEEKWSKKTINPNTVPTAAKPFVSKVDQSLTNLGHIALSCVVPSTPPEISSDLSLDVVNVNSILVALKRKGVVTEQNGRFILSLVRDNLPSISDSAIPEFRQVAKFGWKKTHLDSSHIDKSTSNYTTVIEEVKYKNRREIGNILVLDLLRAPYPDDVQRIEEGQLRYIFEGIYGSPIEEACLFSTISLPRTNPRIREIDCPTRISDELGRVWSQVRSFGFIDADYKTTPTGERIISLLNGAPLAPFGYMSTLERFMDLPAPEPPISEYRDEFLKVVQTGVLYDALSRDCGLENATERMTNTSAVDFFLNEAKDKEFYAPQSLSSNFGIDLTAARNALSRAFLYGIAGVTTASHPHLYKITKKVKGRHEAKQKAK